jgi:peptidoglycan/LPS O-acetylase OafA/YrhL
MGIIRFILALSVVVFHSNNSFLGADLMGGMLAVQMFYVISGFYMTLILNEKYINQNNSYFLFISNRFLRLYPLYYLIFITAIVVNLILYFQFDKSIVQFEIIKNYWDKLSFSTIFYIILANLTIFGQDISLFLGLNLIDGNLFFTPDFNSTNPKVGNFMVLGQAWTISIELMFYLIAPLILRKKKRIVFIILLLSIAIRLIIHFGLNLKNDPWTYRFFPSELFYFLMGYFCYKIYDYFKNYQIPKVYLLGGLITLSILSIFYGNIFKLLHSPSLQSLWHLIYFIIFISLLPFIFNYTKNNKTDTAIGDLSYPLYLCHGIFIEVSYIVDYNIYFIVINSVVFAYLLNKLISSRIEIYRQKRVV